MRSSGKGKYGISVNRKSNNGGKAMTNENEMALALL